MRQLVRAKGVKPAVNWKGTKCIVCGRVPVKAKGMCDICYRKSLPSTSSARRKMQKYLANQKQFFGGRRDLLLSKTGGVCELCGMTDEESLAKWDKRLEIHHRDGRGRESEAPNHSEDNLMVLCRTCHHSMHFGKPAKGLENENS